MVHSARVYHLIGSGQRRTHQPTHSGQHRLVGVRETWSFSVFVRLCGQFRGQPVGRGRFRVYFPRVKPRL